MKRKRRGGPQGRPPRGRGAGEPREQEQQSVRLQIYLARAGLASRRGSEDLIREGRVKVNGQPAELGQKVEPGRDRVEVNGREVHQQRTEWIALHKPKGYVTTRDDPRGRRTVYDLLPENLHHLFHVGRLDRDSSGLILLTNEGEVANRLLHPRYGTTKEYLADVEGRPDRTELQQLVEGVRLEDGVAHALETELVADLGEDLYRVRLLMEEGRKREVRRMLEAVGHPVRRLFRRRFGPIEVGRLRRGQWRALTPDEVRQLRQAHGPANDTP